EERADHGNAAGHGIPPAMAERHDIAATGRGVNAADESQPLQHVLPPLPGLVPRLTVHVLGTGFLAGRMNPWPAPSYVTGSYVLPAFFISSADFGTVAVTRASSPP